jgi:hypothetical protein
MKEAPTAQHARDCLLRETQEPSEVTNFARGDIQQVLRLFLEDVEGCQAVPIAFEAMAMDRLVASMICRQQTSEWVGTAHGP